MSANFRVKIGKYRQRGKTVFAVDLRKEGLGRKFFNVKKDAEKWAEEKETELNEHGRRALLLTDADKLELFSSKEKLQPLGASIGQAVDYFISHHASRSPKKIKDAVNALLDAKRGAGCSDGYISHMDCVLGGFVTLSGENLVHEITQADCEKWLNGANWEPATKKYNLKDLNTFFNFCLKHGWTKLNPCKKIEPIRVDEFSKGILTPDQTKVLLETCKAHDVKLLRYFADQLFGGLREDEAANLEEKNVEETYVHLPKTKIGQERFNEFNETWLRWRPTGDYAPIVNLRRRATEIRNLAKKEMLKQKFIKADWWFSPNSLRHSFCTYFAPLIGAEKTARLAGHSEKTQKRHYRRPVPIAICQSFAAI